MKLDLFKICTAIGMSVVMFSCTKEDNPPAIQPYTVPDTYNFSNASFTEASQSISMWAGLTSYLGKSTSRKLSQDTANSLWNNTNAAFTAEIASNLLFSPDELNSTTSVKLSDQTAEPATIKGFIDSMVAVSNYFEATASKGVPGKIGNRLFNYSGLEFNQAVAKGMMGSFAMKKIFEHLDKSAIADNNTALGATGTAMEHEWDMAFGYVGIPQADYINRSADTIYSFPNTNPGRPLAIGGYFRERGAYIKAGQKVYDAFIEGRAAIGAKDYAVRDASIVIIKEYIEKTLAAAAYHYVTSPQTQAEFSSKFHGLSEGYGFIVALKHRPGNSKLSPANYQKLMGILSTDFYVLAEDASNTKLKEAQAILVSAYGQLQP